MNLILKTATATLFGVALAHGAFAAGKLEAGGNVNQEAFVEESASVAIGEDATSVQGANIACNAEIGGDLNQKAFVRRSASVAIGERATSIQGSNIVGGSDCFK
ncbi:MAG: hypothetical protein ACPGSI_03080 [Pikeienuella sp.]